ncbi:MAG: response regulator [Candidatus Aminicenantes bacterium]|jgi:CheY-like chemotaxis protein
MKKTKVKILLLEDNPIHREVLFDGLEDAGYEVRKARNADAADKILEEFKPDLFLFDIVIENIKSAGYQFAKKLRTNPEFQSVPVLFISAHMDIMHKEKIFPPDSNEHTLKKPFDFDQLFKKIGEVLKT